MNLSFFQLIEIFGGTQVYYCIWVRQNNEKQPLRLKSGSKMMRMCNITLFTPSLFLFAMVTDIPNSCCPTYCFAFTIPACLPACVECLWRL